MWNKYFVVIIARSRRALSGCIQPYRRQQRSPPADHVTHLRETGRVFVVHFFFILNRL